MTIQQEQQLFDYLATHRPLRTWLTDQLSAQDAILRVNTEMAQIHKAQGAVAVLQRMISMMDAADKRRAP